MIFKNIKAYSAISAQVAQSVEQRIENPRVGGSIPSLGTTRSTEVERFFSPKVSCLRYLV